MNWNFLLFPGILYAKIREETEALTARILDIETGNLGEERPFGEKENVFLQKLCSRSIAGFFEKKAAYEEKIAQEPEVFTLDGERFTNRRSESYIQRDKKFPMDLFYENGKIWAVLMSGRDYTGILVKEGMEENTVLKIWDEVYPGQAVFWRPVSGNRVCKDQGTGKCWLRMIYLPVRGTAFSHGSDPYPLW